MAAVQAADGSTPMDQAIIRDVISGPALVIGGVLAAAITLGVAVVSESVVLGLLRWGQPLRAVRDAALVNLASGLLGIAAAVIIGEDLPVESALWAIMVGSWALSVLIEGALLAWLGGREQPRWRPWSFALIMNVVSYGILAALVALIAQS